MTFRILIALCIWLGLTMPAGAHPPYEWVMKYVNANGKSCCHATEDKKGHALITTYGCLFRWSGG